MSKHTPGPWEYVPSDQHHGPYVVGPHGGDIADCYVMSKPGGLSIRNGGDSEPVHFFAEMADPNARLIATAPELLEICKRQREELRLIRMKDCGAVYDTTVRIEADMVIAKAEDQTE